MTPAKTADSRRGRRPATRATGLQDARTAGRSRIPPTGSAGPTDRPRCIRSGRSARSRVPPGPSVAVPRPARPEPREAVRPGRPVPAPAWRTASGRSRARRRGRPRWSSARRKPWDSPSKTTSRQRHRRARPARSANRSDWSAGTTGSSAPWSSSTWPDTRSALVDRRAVPVGLGRLRPRADQRVDVAGLEVVGVGGQGLQVGHPVPGRGPGEPSGPDQGRRGRSALRRWCPGWPSGRRRPARRGQGRGVGDAVVDVGLAPQAVAGARR